MKNLVKELRRSGYGMNTLVMDHSTNTLAITLGKRCCFCDYE